MAATASSAVGALRRGFRIGFGQQVTGDLQADEPVVGHVLVERADDEAPGTGRLGPVLVEGVSVALGKSHQIQPVAAPAFSVFFWLASSRSISAAQPPRSPFPPRPGISVDRRELEGGRSFEVDSAEQRGRSRPGIGREPFGSLGSADEPVDVGSNHVSIGDCRRLGFPPAAGTTSGSCRPGHQWPGWRRPCRPVDRGRPVGSTSRSRPRSTRAAWPSVAS
ncbi:MAG: hypothetical protein CM1200mP2_27500 [Planctomycetaceae bacterium]|nr:MAG: hypothetical protein CM1200mP2_27500 [Planctomycetaceae bacterium]